MKKRKAKLIRCKDFCSVTKLIPNNTYLITVKDRIPASVIERLMSEFKEELKNQNIKVLIFNV